MKEKSGLKLAFLIIGSFVGGGFASGREILVYFSKFGYISLFFCVLVGFLLYFLFKHFLIISHYNESGFYYTTKVFNRNINLKFPIIFCNLILIGSMFAGVYELGNILAEGFGFYLQIITFIIAFFVLLKGLKSLELFNFVLVPLMLISLVMVILFSFGNYEIGVTQSKPMMSLFNCVLYVFFNMLTLTTFLLEVGKYYSFKQIKKASVVSSTALTLILIIISGFFITYYNTMQYFSLPIVTLAQSISKTVGYVLMIIIYVSMFTTLLSTSFGVKQCLKNKTKDVYSILITLFLGFFISLVGFSEIINKLYFALGIIGFLFSFFVINKKLKTPSLRS